MLVGGELGIWALRLPLPGAWTPPPLTSGVSGSPELWRGQGSFFSPANVSLLPAGRGAARLLLPRAPFLTGGAAAEGCQPETGLLGPRVSARDQGHCPRPCLPPGPWALGHAAVSRPLQWPAGPACLGLSSCFSEDEGRPITRTPSTIPAPSEIGRSQPRPLSSGCSCWSRPGTGFWRGPCNKDGM